MANAHVLDKKKHCCCCCYLEKAIKTKDQGEGMEAEEFRDGAFASAVPTLKVRARAKKKGPRSFPLSTHIS